MNTSRFAMIEPSLATFVGILLCCLGFTCVLGTSVAIGLPGAVLAGSQGSLPRLTLVAGALLLMLGVCSFTAAFRARERQRRSSPS